MRASSSTRKSAVVVVVMLVLPNRRERTTVRSSVSQASTGQTELTISWQYHTARRQLRRGPLVLHDPVRNEVSCACDRLRDGCLAGSPIQAWPIASNPR